MTKITIEDKYGKAEVTDNRDDLNIFEISDLLKKVVIASGYSSDLLLDIFKEVE